MRRIASGRAGGQGRPGTSVLCCLPVLLLCPLLLFPQPSQAPGRHRTLHSVKEVYALSKTEAAKAYPIELEGIVTYSDPEWGVMFLQNQAGPTFIDSHGSGARLPSGTHVRVEALTGANSQGPTVVHPRIVVLGHGSVPKPEKKSLAALEDGTDESNLVVTEGVLRPCERDYGRVCFRIFDGKNAAWIVVPQPESPVALSLVGATVRVKAVLGRHLDDANKRLGAQLYVNSLDDIQVEAPPAAPGFSSPAIPIQELRSEDADQRFVSQVHLRGAVTWQSEGLFSIQDSSGMVFVGANKDVSVHSGSTVDAIGFPSHGRFGLVLADSTVKLSPLQPNAANIEPIRLTAADVIKRSLQGSRVRLKARLIGQSANPTEFVYQLEDGAQRFNAILRRNDVTHEVVGLSPDSVLELTGIALIKNGTAEWPGELLILIESPKDIVVLGGNSWLTPRRALAILSVILLCVLVPIAWGTMLRRTVRKQTETIRARLESEVRLDTKFRRLFERNLAAVYTWRPDGTIVDCNMAFVSLLGFRSRADVIGRSYWDFLVDPADREQLSGALREKALSNRDTSLRRDDGSTLHLLTNITPVDTDEGTLHETTAIDVTQFRLNQAELQRARDAAVYESLNDPLTGLPNRRLLMDTLASRLVEARKDGGMIGLLYLDLDGFKLVNDSLGHSVGDELLVQLAERLRSSIRGGDMLARLGGDEFMVIMQKLQSRADAVLLAESLLQAIAEPFHVKEHILAIGVSIGVSIFPTDATGAAELLQQADSAMYVAKREGRNRVMSFTPEIGSQVHERLTLENLLRGAVARHEIFLHYQPEFDLADGRLTRFEALARWTHPNIGEVPPMKFIPIAEESGMIWALGAFIMEQACREAVRWQTMMPYPIQVGVNVSSVQFRRKGFVEEVCAILERTGLKPELLQIEITESAMLGGVQQATEALYRLRELGISMAIDDFGTGYSNLSYLPSLAFDVLKIDRSFVTNLDSQPEAESMIRTLIELAHGFGMQVIVEGVETNEQMALIKALGANEVQGYLSGRPTLNPAEHMLKTASL